MSQPDATVPASSPAEPPPVDPVLQWADNPHCPTIAYRLINHMRSQGRVAPPEAFALVGLPVDSPRAPARTAPADPPDSAAQPAPAPSDPTGRGWIPAARDLGIPSDHDGAAVDPFATLVHKPVFTRELRVRFLDHLAFTGNARAAARHVGVSHETAYRARRQDPALAALWDAALVHARHHAESALATRALDGVEVAIWYRGECVGREVRHDTRLLLAHLARLDRKVESDAAACARAERFDELLAAYAGHRPPWGFAAAMDEAERCGAAAGAPDLPPTRAAYQAWSGAQALEEFAEADEAEQAAAMAEAADEAEAEFDEWHDSALAAVAAIVEGEAAPPVESHAEPPVEVKSAPPGPCHRRQPPPWREPGRPASALARCVNRRVISGSYAGAEAARGET
jgi:hypothetical protein